MVGGKHADDRFRIEPMQQETCQADGGRGISWFGLHDDVLGGDPGQLADDLIVDEVVGDDPEVSFFAQRQETLYGLLNHGLFSIQREHLFRQAATAPRPEARSAPTCQYHWIEIRHRKQLSS